MLRVNEIYHSFQGEGPNTGDPTMFVRFVGCNLKCPGWPCDTQHAIDPKLYRASMQTYSPSQLAERILEEYRFGERICLTGGEVTLQPIQDLQSALGQIKHHTGSDIELFTNGTLTWPDRFEEMFSNIILDWKLPGSGEMFTKEQQGRRDYNVARLRTYDAIKFTIACMEDFVTAAEYWRSELAFGLPGEQTPLVYCGPVWGLVEAEEVAQWIMDAGLPWCLNVQTHKFIWHPDKRGV